MNKIRELREIIAKREIVAGNFDVSVSVTASTASAVTMSFKGNTSMSPGYVYTPYIPLQFSNISKGSTSWGNPVL